MSGEIELEVLAHSIWECEGRPHGCEMRHWAMSCKLAEAAAMAPDRNAAIANRCHCPPGVRGNGVSTARDV